MCLLQGPRSGRADALNGVHVGDGPDVRGTLVFSHPALPQLPVPAPTLSQRLRLQLGTVTNMGHRCLTSLVHLSPKRHLGFTY